ncbi:oxygenase MpaB family protein [Nocardia rhizosphaerihabitans]|uniref:Secreted protein n=1 Tax=Nocardia rhizosphaerihabitans TaxID=1691570 RepID=A0ABQ2KT02_9NOCA|nr:oxygenase MpaB family protein [Nocardia rhizosphaerihabitans]GGN91805.1 secreted protein [Nocardia rhizosphaerihabitans]
MDGLNRRDALKAGGILGALGALGVVAPARAQPWTWSPQGSVAGSGSGADPMTVWDPEADDLVAGLIDRGEVPRVNELLRTWTKNGQALPAGLPSELRDFMEYARRLPHWTDQAKLATAIEFNKKRGLYLGVLYGFASGMMSTVIPKEARAVYYSKGGHDLEDRISKTAKLGYDIGSANAYSADGEMIVTCVKTRLVHAAVRHLLPQSPHWVHSAEEDIPISQNDIMVTWHSLPTTVMKHLTSWQVPIPAHESDAFLHSWQVAAHMLGVRDEYIPNSWAAANSQAAQVLDPIIAATPEGAKLADRLLSLGANIDLSVLSKPVLGAFTRFLLGDTIADGLAIPREPVWDPLLRFSWGPFIAVREGILGAVPPMADPYWLLDEFLRKAALIYLAELRMPISIEIPTMNRDMSVPPR